ncbi:transposase [Clostridium sp.]|uniref:transposase n=1 Tax=Clostridium sp. TaxID=1506 RepID=UPI00284858D0|nr:transposase [Clostridium sp.]MDR3594230.1 transposase [Clostridium sp.]
MPTKSIKVTLQYCKENVLKEKDFFKELRDLQYNTYRACNQAISYLYQNDMQNLLQKELDIPKKDDKLIYGKTFGSWIENRLNEYMVGALSNNVAQTRQLVTARYNNDKKQGLLKGDVSLTRFKRNIPLIIHNKAYKVIDTPKGLGLEIGFFNTFKQNELGIKRVRFILPNLGGAEKATLKRLLDGSYKLGTGQIKFNERKKKWQIAIAYTFEQEPKEVNEDLVMGIDLGISKVATMSVYNTSTEEYQLISFKERCIDGAELISYRQKLESRRKATAIASKWASDNNTGKGYKARMELSNSIGDKYKRFRDTYNHKISRYIVDLAVKYKVALIQMEDLSGFSDQQEESLLRNWSYYDLQQKVQYKAEEKSIKVHLINPEFTSQRCSECGNIDKDNRLTQKEFICTTCGYKENADINASKNIAIPTIESIIKEHVKGQEKQKNK